MELNIVKEGEFSIKLNVIYWIYVRYISPPFEGGVAGPLFSVMMRMLIPAGVVDCLFKFRTFSFEGFFISFLYKFWYLEYYRINHPGREIKYCIYKIINRPDHPSFKRRGNFFTQFLIHFQSLSWRLWLYTVNGIYCRAMPWRGLLDAVKHIYKPVNWFSVFPSCRSLYNQFRFDYFCSAKVGYFYLIILIN